MNNEMLAVSFLKIAIAKTDYLVPHINDGDREPSWDGDIEVYRKAGKVHSKEDLVLKVPIQVKGYAVQEMSKKKTVSYPIEISDLRNYLNEGGTVFFVVHINEVDDKYQIYYSCMLPYELKKILAKYGEQKTRNMPMVALPNDKVAIANIFLNCARDMKKQKAAIHTDDVSYEDLIRSGSIPELSMGFSAVTSDDEIPFGYMFDNGAYLYAKLPHGVELPIGHMTKLDAAFTENNAQITVNGKVFYERYGVCFKKDWEELRFGQSSKFILYHNTQKQKFTFTLAGTLSERIRDEEFVIDALSAGCVEVDGVVCPFDEATPEELASFNIPVRREHLKWMKRIKEILDKLNVQEELNCVGISEEDERKLRMLDAAIGGEQPVILNCGPNLLSRLAISNLTMLICVKPVADNPNKFRLYDFNKCPLKITAMNDDGTMVPSSAYAILKKEHFLECCNVNYQEMLSQLRAVPFSERYSSQVTLLLLELLLAYDASKDKRSDILEAAIEMASWLRTDDVYTPKPIRDLNYYQAIKRSRKLSNEERCDLIDMIENKPDKESAYTGAYLLLDEQSAAHMHYERMDEETREVFRTYPIFRFWQELQ